MTGYFAAVGEYIDNGIRKTDAWIGHAGTLAILHAKDINFDPKLEDVILQLDIIGDKITYWAWPANQPRAAEPNGSIIDDTIASGDIYLWASSPGLSNQTTGRAAFRYVHVATTPIPEPSTVALASFAPLVFGLWWWRRR